MRQELKCGNIHPEKIEDAWNMIETGLLASRYATLFADSISQASFYSEDMDVDRHDPSKVIDLENCNSSLYRTIIAKMCLSLLIPLCDHLMTRK